MPLPKKGEEKDKYIERCIPIVIDHGTAKTEKQAVAICYSMWDQYKVNEELLNKIMKLL
ncbi:MAG: hypothetical protein ACOC56_00860 [Atribacterota bacterium]